MFTFRKTLILAFLISLLLFPVSKDATAEISVEHDDFLKTTMYESSIIDVFINIRPWEEVYFRIIEDENKIMRSGLVLKKVEREWHFFTDSDLLMRIDGGEIIRIPCSVADSRREGRNRLATRGVYILERHILGKLKDANQVVLRVSMSNNPAITWEVPDLVLDEWKELIKMVGL